MATIPTMTADFSTTETGFNKQGADDFVRSLFLFPNSDTTGILQLLDKKQEKWEQNHACDPHAAKTEVHGKQRGKGRQICLRGEKLWFQNASLQKENQLQHQQTYGEGAMTDEKCQRSPWQQNSPCAEDGQKIYKRN